MLQAFYSLMISLPEILKLIAAIQKAIEAEKKESEVQRKLKDDVKTIHEAISSNDPDKLRRLFAK